MTLAAARALLAERAPQLLDEIKVGGHHTRPMIRRPDRALTPDEAMALVQAWQINNAHAYDEEDAAYFLARLTVTRAEAQQMGPE